MGGPVDQINDKTYFSFLSLRPEIRLQIYEGLLIANSKEYHLFYSDPDGRVPGLSLPTQILRVNKQISVEATPILYQGNALSIDLSAPLHHCGMHKERKNPPEALIRKQRPQNKYYTNPGLVYPHCLQRLAHISLEIHVASAWTNWVWP